jgi:hypothetical protein
VSSHSHCAVLFEAQMFPFYSYVGPEFPKLLGKPSVEYRQANLTVESELFVCPHLPAINPCPLQLQSRTVSILPKIKRPTTMSLISQARFGVIALRWCGKFNLMSYEQSNRTMHSIGANQGNLQRGTTNRARSCPSESKGLRAPPASILRNARKRDK